MDRLANEETTCGLAVSFLIPFYFFKHILDFHNTSSGVTVRMLLGIDNLRARPYSYVRKVLIMKFHIPYAMKQGIGG